jgi:hypothetical protein
MMPRLMTAADSTTDTPAGYSRRAGVCVEILGWLTLLRLDLLGLVLIKAGRGVRARNRKWWKVAVGLWAVHLAVWLIVGVVAATIGGTVSLFGKTWSIQFRPWMYVVFALAGLALVVPFIWLIAPATRRAMSLAVAGPLPQLPGLAYSAGNQEGGSHDQTCIHGGDDAADGDRDACPRPGTV